MCFNYYFCFTIIMKKNIFYIFLCCLVILTSCSKSGVFEKNVSIPQYKWEYSFKPAFEFDITDTVSSYNLYIVIRHTDAFKYNNIWLNVGTQVPSDTVHYRRFDLQLGSDNKGWEGTGMDDIWELRKPVTNGPFKFHHSGKYKFSIAQIMRENPLLHVMSIGLRVEKINTQ